MPCKARVEEVFVKFAGANVMEIEKAHEGCSRGLGRRYALRHYLIFNNSTSNVSSASGGMTLPAPRLP